MVGTHLMHHRGGQRIRDPRPNLLTLNGGVVDVAGLFRICIRNETIDGTQRTVAETHDIVCVDRLQRCSNVLFRKYLETNGQMAKTFGGGSTHIIIEAAAPQIPVTAQLIGHDRFLCTARRIEFVISFVPKLFLESVLAFLQNLAESDAVLRLVHQTGHHRDAMQRCQPQAAAIRTGSVHHPRIECLVG